MQALAQQPVGGQGGGAAYGGGKGQVEVLGIGQHQPGVDPGATGQQPSGCQQHVSAVAFSEAAVEGGVKGPGHHCGDYQGEQHVY